MENTELSVQQTDDKQEISIELVRKLWTQRYNAEGKADWSHIMPYYDENIYFRDTVQEIHGIEEFKAVTERLSARSEGLSMNVTHIAKEENIIFVEWEMTLSFKKYPSSIMYGASRLTIDEENRKILVQRDYYDLWGDIFDNIPKFGKMYRKFMKKKFG
jgi:limonene-1,2-epoxide hydrolase